MTKKIYPLGECQIKYTPKEGTEVIIATTLKEDECSLTVTTSGYKIEVDQLEGPYLYNTKIDEASFKCSSFFDLEQFEKVSNLLEKGTTGLAFSASGKPVQVGKLEIHPVAAGENKEFDIVAPKAFLLPTINLNYKKEGVSKVDFNFEFASDETAESPTFGKLFTLGNYTKS